MATHAMQQQQYHHQQRQQQQQQQQQPTDQSHVQTNNLDIDLSTIDGGSTSHLAFLKDFSSDKKQTKDGLPPKRRGPKPDSKPALTRRQELNRQAQRTHRERKEMYIKALEQEVLRLKELYVQSAKERDHIAEENRRLKALLAAHGIRYDFDSTPINFKNESASSGSISGSYRLTSDTTSQDSPSPAAAVAASSTGQRSHRETDLSPRSQQSSHTTMAQLPSNRLDYDQTGINFVLTLERPCMEHMQYLLVRSQNPEKQFFHHPMENSDDSEHEHMAGHALMATAPLHSHIMEKPDEQYPHQMPEMSKPDLVKLLDLSNRLPLDRQGEITPIMAWTLILKHPKCAVLDESDFAAIQSTLSPKVTCYGFGAVIEEFEVRDALYAVLQQKSGMVVDTPLFAPDDVPDYII